MSKLPLLEHQEDIEESVVRSQNPSKKKYDFFIIYQSKDINGHTINDEEYALNLQTVLHEEKFMERKAIVGISSEGPKDMMETFKKMSTSVVVLVILSEAAIQTFAKEAEVHEQNNFLLLIQFALKLHDACGVRILSLNLSAIDESDPNTKFFTKFEGWQVRFSDSPHPSPLIQDNIAKSMQRLFAIQGISIDLEDWEFKVPTLFTSLHSAQDDLNATGWPTSFKIIPWRPMWGILINFGLSFFLPMLGYSLSWIYRSCRFSKKEQHKKDAHANISLFATGLAMFVVSAVSLGYTIIRSVKGALCSSNGVKCEVMVRAGDKWAVWRDYNAGCTCDTSSWSQEFPSDCAKCICDNIRHLYNYCHKFGLYSFIPIFHFYHYVGTFFLFHGSMQKNKK
eukprot:Phypoly_transcript_01798.p1 GENE.Phypoly_transcript_01798~~Phypoly_transcript_01798.p1  ORF type:complete len:395 (+),score=31.47 Phypoly_transcript_01798:1614-2798(+)